MKKISFCITCMNRLSHLKATLERNILDNFLVNEVEFVVLDYNSQDGVSGWIHRNMGKYLKSGILVYYRTIQPIHYLRSHSRNMVFQLAKGDIVCNLDADNFLGKGFAKFMLEAFGDEQCFFYTSNLHSRDVFGRVCLTKKDFISVRGYNEALIGYGFEDVELYNRLIISGLQQKIFDQKEFYNAITHSDVERISQEPQSQGLYKIFLHYIGPYSSHVLLLYNNHCYESGIIINNVELNYNLSVPTEGVQYAMDERARVTINGDWEKGSWIDMEHSIVLTFLNKERLLSKGDKKLHYEQIVYYEIITSDLITAIIMIVTSALNFLETQKIIQSNKCINPDGFGRGDVYKNFDFYNKIQL